jgi:hypothetical protein
LENLPTTLMHSHIVVASKFSIPPITLAIRNNSTTYEISKEVLRIIKQGIEVFKLLED